MNEQDAWNKFFLTGSVRDYLNIKSIQQVNNRCNESKNRANEIHHTGTDNQTTEYR